MSDFGVRFGLLVRQKRGLHGYSQKSLAAEIWQDEGRAPHISRLEAGKVANPQAKTVDELCATLHISNDELRACREPVVLPAEGDRPDLPPLLLENLAMRFGIASPDASAAELEAYLHEAAKEFRDMKARLDALAEADGRIANLVGAAKGALDAGEFAEADARLADAEEIQQTEHTLVQVRKQAKIRTERGKAALMNFDVETAYLHFCEAAAFFEPFDKVEAFNARNDSSRQFFEHGNRFAGEAPKAQEKINRLNIERTPRAEFPEAWALAQNNLALALQNRGIRAEGETGQILLAKAVTAYRAALEVRTRDAMPVQWAMTQNNLGATLRNQGNRAEGEGGQTLLAEAVTAYRAALEVRTRDAMPEQWAMTQNNLGAALRNQGSRAEGKTGLALLAEAVTAYRAALEVRTREAMPVQWATTQNNLGNALSALGEREEGDAGLTLLTQAVAAWHAALQVRTRDAIPVQWAETNENLATAFEAMAEKEPDQQKAHLQTALTHVDVGLEVYDPEHMSYHFQGATKSRERILAKLAALGSEG